MKVFRGGPPSLVGHAQAFGDDMDLHSLAGVYQHHAPFATIYLDTSGAVDHALQRIETRWKDVLRELREAGIDGQTCEALTAARGPAPHLEGSTLVLVASAGQVHLARSLPDAPATEIVRVSALPYLLPLVDWAQTRVPYVIVLTDREGGDVLGYTDDASPDITGTVDAARFPIHKTGKGGWSALRFEHKVENDWKATARDVAESVSRAAELLSARLIIAAGDVHAVQDVREALPENLQSRYVVVEGGRARDGSDELVATRVLEELAKVVAADTEALLADFAEAIARGAADGVVATVAALQMAQVATLLLSEAMDETASLFFGPDPLQLSVSPSDVVDMGAAVATEGSAVDVLLRAALASDADVRLVPADTSASPSEGVGALLRFTT
jgi:hypothetical protein